MDAPFFANQWPVPSHRRYYHPPSPVPSHRSPAPPRPKIVAIPVRFVDAEGTQSESVAALKIQSLYRGYVVRKSLKRIAAIAKEVDEIQRRVEDAEVVDLMRRESKERLKVNEWLMNLLFRLDSVRGVDSGVREFRKKVIRRAVALQEKVDAIVAVEETEESPNIEDRGECELTKSEAIVVIEEKEEEKEEQLAHGETGDATTSPTAEERDLSVRDGTDARVEKSNHCVDAVGIACDENMKGVVQPPELAAERQRGTSIGNGSEPQTMDAGLCTNEVKEDSRAESESGSSLNPESPIEAVEEYKQETIVETVEAGGRDSEKSEREIKEERSRELLERMAEDNEKMMALMAELFERNERQTTLLSLLSQRVEQLEKAFVCEKLRKKKKRQACGGTGGADGSDTFRDSKNCGKRQNNVLFFEE